jgi:hypothetical protein
MLYFIIISTFEWKLSRTGSNGWENSYKLRVSTQLHDAFLFNLPVSPEDWGDMFLRNVRWLPMDCARRYFLEDTRNLHIHCCQDLKSYRAITGRCNNINLTEGWLLTTPVSYSEDPSLESLYGNRLRNLTFFHNPTWSFASFHMPWDLKFLSLK